MLTCEELTESSDLIKEQFQGGVAAGTLILTDCGAKKIEEIQIGDKVLTHKGRFREVIITKKKNNRGQLVEINVFGHNRPVYIDSNQWLWHSDDFYNLDNLNETHIPNISELSGLTEIDLRNYVDEYYTKLTKYNGEYIYPTGGDLRWTDIIRICTLNEPTKLLSKELKVHRLHISRIRRQFKNGDFGPREKQAVPIKILLNRDFGLILGYYASEGSTSRNTVTFAMDGHTESPIVEYINELNQAIKNIFHLDTKSRPVLGQNCTKICIERKYIKNLFDSICPGLSHTKFIIPEILFSNNEVLKGFIKGYWSGDGCIKSCGTSSKSCSTSINLSIQVRLVCGILGLSTSWSLLKDRLLKTSKGWSRCKSQYQNSLNGYNCHNLKNLLNIIDITKIRKSTRINNNGKISTFRIKKIDLKNYHGYLYSLNVKEDYSFSTPIGSMKGIS